MIRMLTFYSLEIVGEINTARNPSTTHPQRIRSGTSPWTTLHSMTSQTASITYFQPLPPPRYPISVSHKAPPKPSQPLQSTPNLTTKLMSSSPSLRQCHLRDYQMALWMHSLKPRPKFSSSCSAAAPSSVLRQCGNPSYTHLSSSA